MASTVSITNNALRQLVIFRLGARTYGIELDTVREIIPFRGATRLPGAPSRVAGLVNVRGAVVTVLDLGGWFGCSPAVPGRGSVILVEHGGRLVGVVVDEVLDIRRLADVELDEGSEALMPGGTVSGLGRLDDEIITLVDTHAVISQGLA